MATFRDYHDLYNMAGALQLADTFENFRDLSMKYYKSDPLWYYTTLGLLTKTELEIPCDYNILLMFMAGTRGGISSIMHRHAVANNKYMENYDQTKLSSFIVYLNANNLYGWAMCQLLPTGRFK
jgi:hypothetical protein